MVVAQTADILAGARWLAVNRSNKLCIMGEHEHCTNMVTWGSSGGGMCGYVLWQHNPYRQ